MKYLCLIVFFNIFLSCKTKKANDVKILSDDQFEDFYLTEIDGLDTVDELLLRYLNMDQPNERFKISSTKIDKNNTLVEINDTKGYHNISRNIYWKNKFTTNLTCSGEIKLQYKSFIFIFCEKDIIDFLDSKKSTYIDPKKRNNYEVLRTFFQEIKTDKSINLPYKAQLVISDLIENIPFSINNINGTEISSVSIGEFDIGYAGGFMHYIIDKKNDSIAYFKFITWVR